MEDEDRSERDADRGGEQAGSGEMGPWDSTMAPADEREAGHGERSSGEGSGDGPDADDGGEGTVAGSFAPDVPVEPGRPEPINVAWVVIGAYVGVLAIAGFVGGVGQFSLVDYASISLGYFVLAGLVYGFFARTNPDT